MAAFALKVKTKSGQHIIRSLTGDSTIANLKQSLSELTNIKSVRLHILFGFPPKPLNLSSSGQTLTSAGVFSGDTLIVDEKEPQVIENEVISEPNALDTITPPIGNDRPGILMKKVVPSDNSCLFTSIGFVLNGKVDTAVSSYMREIIAQVVSSDTETYSEGFLGKPNRDYCDWIQNPNSWGGAIEVSVLSRFYGIEMAVVDTLNAIINRFGEDQNYGQRVFLLFDGVHYDPLYLEQIQGGIQTLFAIEDEDILREAEQLAKEAKSARQFTDLNKFTLKCMVCNILLTGQVEAQKHAMETAHASFGEV